MTTAVVTAAVTAWFGSATALALVLGAAIRLAEQRRAGLSR